MDWLKLLSHQRPGRIAPGNASATDSNHLVRSAFEQDYDRIIFSHAFRRLQDKTQVHPLPEHDFVHTRLTHSLEVSSVGRSLGKKAGEQLVQRYPELQQRQFSAFDFGAIVAAASLAHDLGNPPFGHSGETAISDFFLHHPIGQRIQAELTDAQWEDVTHFEGNAQGFRILNMRGRQGLNLTCATLAAFSKYPCQALMPGRDKQRCSQKKYGFFQGELAVFNEVAHETGLLATGTEGQAAWCRHPLAFLVEAADDICYHIIDLEDGCRLGLVGLEETKELLRPILGQRFKPDKWAAITDPNEKVGVLRAMVIGILIEQASEVFMTYEADMLAGRFDSTLVSQIPAADALKAISKVSVQQIYRSREVLEREAAGFEVLAGLLEKFIGAVWFARHEKSVTGKHKSTIRLMPAELKAALDDEHTPLFDVVMLTIDYIAGMTDSFAVNLYRKLQGIALPGR